MKVIDVLRIISYVRILVIGAVKVDDITTNVSRQMIQSKTLIYGGPPHI